MEGIRLKVDGWATLQDGCRSIRDEVFVVEQGVPTVLEYDAKDPLCVHVLAVDNQGRPVGTGRLQPNGHIDRMAVKKAYRGKGVGGAVLAMLIEEARERGHAEVTLNAQISALRFYRDFDFEEIGARFVEAGLEHQAMRLKLLP